MRQIVSFSLQRRPLVVLLFFAFIVVGLIGFTKLNIEAYPDPVPPQVVIITQNSGQSAEEIERYVTIPIELAMAGMPNLTSVRSTSLFGLSDVRVQFNFNFNYEQALQQVLNRLAQVDGLPEGAHPTISPLSPIGEIMRYRLVGPPGFGLDDLKSLQDWVLNRRFKRVPGVVDVTSFGGLSKSYNAVIDLSRLVAYRLTLPQVIAAIRASNTTVGAGIIRIGPQAAVVQGIGLIRGIEDLEKVVLTAQDGVSVKLSDVATIEIGNLPRLGVAGHEADNDVVLATILMRRGEQTLPTIRAVQQEVARINAGGILPPGVRIVPLYDREDLVKITTKTVVKNIIEGVALILLIQWLFLGDFRGALVVAATVPFAFLFAIITMLLRGESANLLSLGALDFGLLVDATVIMVENIYRHLGLARRQGVVHGAVPTASGGLSGLPLTIFRAASEVDKAIFFSALIIIAAFIPLFTLGGVEGRIFGPMSKTYAYAIIGALFATFTVTPALAALMLKEESSERDTPLVRVLRRGHQWLYQRAMAARALCLTMAMALLVAAMMLLSTLGAEFLPTLEEGNLWVRATMPGTISLEEGNGTVNRIRAVLMEFPEVITATSQQGRPDDGTDSAGFSNAEFFLPLRPPAEWTTAPNRDGLVQAMQHRLSQEFLGIEFSYAQAISDNVQEAASGVKGANAVKVFGPELDIIANTANRIAEQMQHVPGVADMAVFRSLGQPTVAITIDRDRAARFGLSMDDVNQVIQAAIGGREAGRLYEPGADRNFPITVRLDAGSRDSIDAVRRIPVGAGSTLGDVADIRLISGVSYIYREDASRYVPIRFSVRGRDPASTVAEAQRVVNANVQLPPGYRLDWVGEFRNLQEALGRLQVVVPAAFVLILVLLYVQFNTLRETLLVFGIVPMSLVGGIMALWVAGLNFSVPAAIGFLALFGITVMEGIIMLSHFNHLRSEGMPWRAALDQAGVDRMRPVFMTCFASFTGLLPMALATGIGADVQKPLALVVVGGIGLVPIFILVVFPAMIDLLGKPASERRNAAR